MSDEENECPKCPPEGAAEWMTTYADMVTLLLCFFVLLMNPESIDGSRLELIMAAFSGMGPINGGYTLEAGELAELGHTYQSLLTTSQGQGLAKARKAAVSNFKPEIQSELVKITEDERGLVISLAGDALFKQGSAEVNIEETRDILQKVSLFLKSPEVEGRRFRIEGHTDNSPTDPNGEWPSNWELSSDRAANVLHYLVDYGAPEGQFQIVGMAETQPVAENIDIESRAKNRRVDIIILSDGHL